MLSESQIRIISSVFSIQSTVSWVIAQLPQQIKNYRLKSADGLSPHFLLLWLAGDFLNFIGCILTNQLPFQLYLSLYFLFNDTVLNIQYLLYREKPSRSPSHSRYYSTGNSESVDVGSVFPLRREITMAVAAGIPTVVDAIPITTKNEKNSSQLGVLIAWICAIMYTSSRVPQLLKNYRRKSVLGISPFLFAFAVLGNLNYGLSILTSTQVIISSGDIRTRFLMDELPYLVGSLGTVVFDLCYFIQLWNYGKSKPVTENILLIDKTTT